MSVLTIQASPFINFMSSCSTSFSHNFIHILCFYFHNLSKLKYNRWYFSYTPLPLLWKIWSVLVTDNNLQYVLCYRQSVQIRPWKTISQYNITSGQNKKISKYYVWKYFDWKQTLLESNILLGKICRLCPNPILRPDKIFSMDESGVTVQNSVTSEMNFNDLMILWWITAVYNLGTKSLLLKKTENGWNSSN